MDELLAKPNRKLTDHLLEVYKIGKMVAQQLELKDELTQRALLACLLHDAGKATKSFQEYMKAVKVLEEAKARNAPEEEVKKLKAEVNKKRKKAYPHALASFPFILVAEHILLGKPLLASAAIISHHSPLSPLLYEGWNPPNLLPELINVLKEVFTQVQEFKLDANTMYSKALSLNRPADILHRANKKILVEFKNLPARDFAAVKTVLHLADWLASSGKTDTTILVLKNGKVLISNYIALKKYNLWKFQRKTSNLDKSSNLRLRAPTGSGKTEALLLWAGNTQRIIYLLPTQTTVNAMWKRLSKIYGKEKVGISHGRAKYMIYKEWESKKYNEEDPPLDSKLFASVFAKPVIVATLDQFLMGYMNGKHWEERVTLSENATVIIDEIHSYEPFTLGLLKGVFKEYGKPRKLALASATLPDALLNLFGEEYFVEAEETFWCKKRYRISLIDKPIEASIPKVLEIVKSGKKVLIVTNSVQKSQEIYEQISSQWKETTLLHSRFIYRDRVKKENEAMKAPPGTVLISTQIVEVSLDISYDVLLTELAPVDALIQRMGRVNRRGEKSPVEVMIFTKVDENSKEIYGKELLTLSIEIIRELPAVPEEKHFIEATNKLYNEVFSWKYFQEDLKEGEYRIRELRESLGTYTIDLGDEEFRRKFITRKSIYSIDVIPDAFIQEAYELLENGEKWKLIELTVPIHGYWTKIYYEYFDFSTDIGYPITSLEYHPKKGLLKPDNKIPSNSGVIID